MATTSPDREGQNKKALLEAMKKSLGVVTSACKMAGIARNTFYHYYNSDDDFKKACNDCENIALDFAESQLHKQIQEGNPTSIIFFLKCKGKKRGYIEKAEMEQNVTLNGPAQILIVQPDDIDKITNPKASIESPTEAVPGISTTE